MIYFHFIDLKCETCKMRFLRKGEKGNSETKKCGADYKNSGEFNNLYLIVIKGSFIFITIKNDIKILQYILIN